MGAVSTSILAALVSLVVAALTVFLSDFFGLRRDRARLRMEFDWQLQRQRWDALNKALVTCPTFSTDASELLVSVCRLTQWCQTDVEPRMGSDRVSSLKSKREVLDKWSNETGSQFFTNPGPSVRVSIEDIPIAEINEFRKLAVEEVTSAIQRMRSKFSELSQASNL